MAQRKDNFILVIALNLNATATPQMPMLQSLSRSLTNLSGSLKSLFYKKIIKKLFTKLTIKTTEHLFRGTVNVFALKWYKNPCSK